LIATGVDLVAVSGDSKSQLESHIEQLDVSFPIAYGLTVELMHTLGLYISNNPFVRPELQALVNGLGWIRDPDNNYPVRGMHK